MGLGEGFSQFKKYCHFEHVLCEKSFNLVRNDNIEIMPNIYTSTTL